MPKEKYKKIEKKNKMVNLPRETEGQKAKPKPKPKPKPKETVTGNIFKSLKKLSERRKVK